MHSTAHQGASHDDARLASWMPAPGSADADTLDELALLTPRTRDLVRNNAIASGARQTLQDNIIGSQLRLSAQPKYRLLKQTKEWASDWGNSTEDQFSTWADTTECDITRTQTLLGLTTQALSGALINGDVFALILWAPRKDSTWATRLKLIESDRVTTPPWLIGNLSLRSGVELDDDGAPVAYWVQKNHPGDRYGLWYAQQDQWERVPAFTTWGRRQVIHLYDKERAEQTRGKPLFSAVLREFRVAGEYLGAELQAAAANAMIAAFLESDLDPQSVSEIFGNDAASATSYWKGVGETYHRKKLESGMFLTLPVGTKLSGYNPNRPNTAFDGFMESVLRNLSTGLNMPYELLLKDFSKTNYSSARAALLEAWRYFQGRRRWLQDAWLNPIYEAWLEEAVNFKKVDLDVTAFYQNRIAYSRARWVFSGRGWVDQVKEAQAAQLRMEIGVSTLESECADQGLDWEEVLQQRAREKARMEELGLWESFQGAGSKIMPDLVQEEQLPAGKQNVQNN